MSAIIYIVDTLLWLALFVVLVRLLLQWTRADFRNPLCQAVVRLTNPLILPLRRVLPPIGKIDTASVVAVLLVATVKIASLFALNDIGMVTVAAAVGAGGAHRDRAHAAVDLLLRDRAVRAAESDRPRRLLAAAVAADDAVRAGAAPVPPLILPVIAGLDLSPLWAGIAIQALLILLR